MTLSDQILEAVERLKQKNQDVKNSQSEAEQLRERQLRLMRDALEHILDENWICQVLESGKVAAYMPIAKEGKYAGWTLRLAKEPKESAVFHSGFQVQMLYGEEIRLESQFMPADVITQELLVNFASKAIFRLQ